MVEREEALFRGGVPSLCLDSSMMPADKESSLDLHSSIPADKESSLSLHSSATAESSSSGRLCLRLP